MGIAGVCLILFTLLHPRLRINKPKKNELITYSGLNDLSEKINEN